MTDLEAGGVTVTTEDPFFPPLVAVIVAVPAATAVTTPVDATVATFVLLDSQEIGRLTRIVPFTSVTMAVNAAVPGTAMVTVAGLTVTVATGAAVTVTADVPLFPSLVAVIVVEPTATPVTTPVADTDATAAVLEVHVTTRPVRMVPVASFVVAVNCFVAPTATLAVAGATVTVATGADTTTAAVPLLPSDVAVMVAVPGATAVTTPLVETVAMAALLDVHVTTLLVTTVPAVSFTVTDRVAVCPVNSDVLAGESATLPTGTGGTALTVTVAVPLLPSLVAVTVAVPAATPETTPAGDTVATAAGLELHVTVRPESVLPAESFTTVVSVVVWPAVTLVVGGCTDTTATGTGVTVTLALPVCPSLVAEIVATPSVTPVTTPVPETVAIAVLLERHATARSFASAPITSRTIAVSCTLAPWITELACGCTVTLPTGKLETVSAEVPSWPSTVAVIVAVPGATAVTRPWLVTAATPGRDVDQVTGRPVRTAPPASRAVADICVV